jgi:molybdenum cofactor synthesis domain-containing protein
MQNDAMPTAAMLVIGDEILSGRTRDANMHHLAKALTDHGIRLEEVRIVADVHARIVAAVRALSVSYDHLFTSGGIGPTHDDITADAVAEAMGARWTFATTPRHPAGPLRPAGDGIERRPPAHGPCARWRDPDRQSGVRRAGLHARQCPCHGRRAVDLRGDAGRRAADPDRRAAGFVPIAPRRAWRRATSRSLGDLAAAHPEVSIGSYPFQRDGVHGSNVVVRSQDGAAVDTVMAELARLFPEAG